MLSPWGNFDTNLWFVDQMRRRMDRVFKDYESPRGGASVLPRAALYDMGEALVLEAEMPGMTKEAIELTVNRDAVTLSGTRKITPPEGYTAHRRERGELSFGRSFTLPVKIDTEKTKATFENGLLTVTMAKSPESQPRRINIKG